MKPGINSVRVLVAGDVMLDRYWFGDVSRISPEAPVPVVRIERNEERLGGAANVARNTATLGARTSLLGITGQDEAGDAVKKLLDELGITACLYPDMAISTTIKLRVIGRQQQLLRVDFENPPSDAVINDKFALFQQLVTEHDIVIFSDYGKGALTHVKDMIALARQSGKTVLVDPKGDDYSIYKGASILTPNRPELRMVVGSWNSEAQLTQKAQTLRESLGLEYLLLTRSEEGVSLYGEDIVHHIPAIAREVYDVSGAGDTVVATLGTMIGTGADIREAVDIANRAAGIVVGKLGTGAVTPEELFGQQT